MWFAAAKRYPVNYWEAARALPREKSSLRPRSSIRSRVRLFYQKSIYLSIYPVAALPQTALARLSEALPRGSQNDPGCEVILAPQKRSPLARAICRSARIGTQCERAQKRSPLARAIYRSGRMRCNRYSSGSARAIFVKRRPPARYGASVHLRTLSRPSGKQEAAR